LAVDSLEAQFFVVGSLVAESVRVDFLEVQFFVVDSLVAESFVTWNLLNRIILEKSAT
jgi:hypothetical protein